MKGAATPLYMAVSDPELQKHLQFIDRRYHKLHDDDPTDTIPHSSDDALYVLGLAKIAATDNGLGETPPPKIPADQVMVGEFKSPRRKRYVIPIALAILLSPGGSTIMWVSLSSLFALPSVRRGISKALPQ